MATPFSAYFGVNNPVVGPLSVATRESQDIAFILLDRVFGVQGIFNSCVTTAIPCYGLTPQLAFDVASPAAVPLAPWPFHLALHAMFSFYSTGLLIIGILIVIYYAIAITVETAQTGTPFGKRFNSVWAPLRLVVAIGLLVPLGSGLNSAQYIVLYSAKMGSNLATNGWLTFNNALGAAIAGNGLIDSGEMIGTPNAPDAKELITFMILAKSCAIIEDAAMQQLGKMPPLITVQPGGTFATGTQAPLAPYKRNAIKPWLVKSIGAPNNVSYATSHAAGSGSLDTSHADALTFYSNGDILIRFGELNPTRYQKEKGGVYPSCGELILKNSALYEPGAVAVQRGYYELVQRMWADPTIQQIAHHFALQKFPNIPVTLIAGPTPMMGAAPGDGGGPVYKSQWTVPAPIPPTPNASTFTTLVNFYMGLYPVPPNNSIRGIIREAVVTQVGSTDYDLPDQLLSRGWGGAGIWYNRIAQMNGAMVGASRNLPAINLIQKL
ncbi:MAG: hypothetical protein JKY11_07160 [Alphaproteobacteria bacterium]|nr:hypothetical protein [Alphaproteobacteria bacterium]